MPTSSKKKSTSSSKSWWSRAYASQKKRLDAYMARRPHRSFRMTRRRDYVRPLELPGNFAFTHEVNRTLWKYKKVFSLLGLVYIFFFAVLIGVQSQDTYTAFSDALHDQGIEFFSGDWTAGDQALGTLMGIATSTLSGTLTEAQQIYGVFIFLLIWLATVWLLRNLLAGHKVKLRDGLYNSGAPIFSTAIVLGILIVQLVPVGLAVLGYNAASTSGILDGGASAMLFWIGASLLGILSLYWITSTLIALIIVTLPGMYPFQAIKTAGDLMVGRRIKILLRWLWMALVVLLTWVIVLLAFIFIDMGLKALFPVISSWPIVPIVILLLSALTTIWVSAYVYLLYRKAVDYAPAK